VETEEWHQQSPGRADRLVAAVPVLSTSHSCIEETPGVLPSWCGAVRASRLCTRPLVHDAHAAASNIANTSRIPFRVRPAPTSGVRTRAGGSGAHAAAMTRANTTRIPFRVQLSAVVAAHREGAGARVPRDSVRRPVRIRGPCLGGRWRSGSPIDQSVGYGVRRSTTGAPNKRVHPTGALGESCAPPAPKGMRLSLWTSCVHLGERRRASRSISFGRSTRCGRACR
jgi:hypothetical protein